jgi:hypothetical protein
VGDGAVVVFGKNGLHLPLILRRVMQLKLYTTPFREVIYMSENTKTCRSSICVSKIKGTPGHTTEMCTSLGRKKIPIPKIKQLYYTLSNYSARCTLKFQNNMCSSEPVVSETILGGRMDSDETKNTRPVVF